MTGFEGFIVIILSWIVGALWGMAFQKREDLHNIKMLEVRLNHNRAVIDNLNKQLGGKNGN